jgi:hypothetical protein
LFPLRRSVCSFGNDDMASTSKTDRLFSLSSRKVRFDSPYGTRRYVRIHYKSLGYRQWGKYQVYELVQCNGIDHLCIRLQFNVPTPFLNSSLIFTQCTHFSQRRPGYKLLAL